VTFESGSKLSSVGDSAFLHCSALSSICIPSSLQTILAQYEALLKLPAAGVPQGGAVVRLPDSVQGDTINRRKNE
jgi:hypothetical protein